MKKFNINNQLQEVIDDLNKRNFDKALEKLKILYQKDSQNYLIIKLFASIFARKKDWDNAIYYYNKLLSFKNENFKVFNDIGVAQFKIGKINQSIETYQKSIDDTPNVVAYCNLGIAYSEIGDYVNSVKNYIAALKIDQNNHLILGYLIKSFIYFFPTNINDHPLLNANFKIKQLSKNNKTIKLNELENIKKILIESENITKSLNLGFFLNETQIFRSNSKNLNCDRHFKVFNRFNIIPKFCFDCYKVQIYLNNVVDLIKLHFLFDDLNLKNNNIRKCLVEIRPTIQGNYKGIIYCDGLSEAEDILKKIDAIMLENKFKGFKVKIRHGCAEFYSSYPKYEKINFNGEQEIKYNPNWSDKEKIIDSENSARSGIDKKIRSKSLNGLSLPDIMVIKNWIGYADIIGDNSYKLIYDKKIENTFIEKILKSQIDFRKKEFETF